MALHSPAGLGFRDFLGSEYAAGAITPIMDKKFEKYENWDCIEFIRNPRPNFQDCSSLRSILGPLIMPPHQGNGFEKIKKEKVCRILVARLTLILREVCLCEL